MKSIMMIRAMTRFRSMANVGRSDSLRSGKTCVVGVINRFCHRLFRDQPACDESV